LRDGTPPDLARGAALYARDCASCHGAAGAADTAMARTLDPPPIAFTDRARARERSVFALYQVIGQGLEGTAMQSYAHLSAQDRWALAFHISRLAYPDALREGGRQLWQNDPAVRAEVGDLENLVEILDEVRKNGRPITTLPLNVRAADYPGDPDDQFIHSIVPIHGIDGAKPRRLFIYSEKV
jgi:hypothetical protein